MNFVTGDLDVSAYRELYATLAGPNPVASVPSIHMALTFLVLLFVRDLAPKWTWPMVGYNLAMGLSLVYLAEHYVFDLLVGVVMATIAYYAFRSRYAQTTGSAPGVRGRLQPARVPIER
jgi:membrane-associated phospholipid phosphatase